VNKNILLKKTYIYQISLGLLD